VYLVGRAMFQVHRSESGQYVLMHAASETVVVSDDLAAGFARISAAVAGAAGAPAPTAPVRAPVGNGRALIIVALVLPFVWLLVLHLSLGQLAAELAVGLRAPADKAAAASQRELKELRLEISRVEARIKDGPEAAATAEADEDEDEDPADLKPLRPGKDRPPEAKSEVKADAKTEVKADAKTEVKADAKTPRVSGAQ